MTPRRRARHALALVAAVVPFARPASARAQATNGIVNIVPPSVRGASRDTLVSVTPTYVVRAINFGPARPLQYRFQIATSPEFRVPLLVDTSITTFDTTLAIAPARALPSTRVWWRAIVLDPAGGSRTASGGPAVVPPYLTLVEPRGASGVTTTRRPRFVWSSPPVNEPPGPWFYRLFVTNDVGFNLEVTLRDTVYRAERDLEANAPYRWRVEARLAGDPGFGGIVVPATSTFVVEDSALRTSTILYQNFPNPFPTPSVSATCVWFDLERPSRVRLDIFDLRGVHVRRLVPNPELFPAPLLPAGRYGRAVPGGGGNCAPGLAWDGTSDDGRVVPAGLYFLRFEADGVRSVRKILFRGTG